MEHKEGKWATQILATRHEDGMWWSVWCCASQTSNKLIIILRKPMIGSYLRN